MDHTYIREESRKEQRNPTQLTLPSSVCLPPLMSFNSVISPSFPPDSLCTPPSPLRSFPPPSPHFLLYLLLHLHASFNCIFNSSPSVFTIFSTPSPLTPFAPPMPHAIVSLTFPPLLHSFTTYTFCTSHASFNRIFNSSPSAFTISLHYQFYFGYLHSHLLPLRCHLLQSSCSFKTCVTLVNTPISTPPLSLCTQ